MLGNLPLAFVWPTRLARPSLWFVSIMADQSPNSDQPHAHHLDYEVLILGGGFAGVYCGQRISSVFKRAGISPGSAALVSDQNYMVFQPMLAEVAGASISPQHVISPIRQLCRGLSVFRGKVSRVDLEQKQVHVLTGNFSAGLVLHFKHLVFAMGAEIDLSRVPGMPEHAYVMQNVGDAMVLRASILSRLEEANTEFRAEVRRRLLTFVVVGGGYSGVETAGEILDMIHEASRYYQNISSEDLRVVLIHSRERILNTLSDSLGDYAARKLVARGLDLRLSQRVRAVTATKVYLMSGEEISTSLVVSTVGTAPNSILKGLCDAGDLPHENYRLVTDEHLRVTGHEGLWAAGDCASAPLADGGGKPCPQTAQFAMRQGAVLADNIGRQLAGKELKPFLFKGLGELASIGHRTAVANIMGLQFSGLIAWFMWRTIYLLKLPGFDRRLRVMIEWSLDFFFPRDITLLSPRYTKLLQQVHLEPDDLLFTIGEPAFSLYSVRKGQVDLLDEEGRVVRTIQEGDYFGERALIHGNGYRFDAIARGSTELVSLSGEIVLPFLQSSRRFRRILAKTSAQDSTAGEIDSVMKKLDPALLDNLACDVMRTDLATLSTDYTVGDALALFRERRFSIYPVVDALGKFHGVLSREEIFDFIKREDVNDSTTLSQVEMMHLPICHTSDPVEGALEKMIHYGRYKCLVTDSDDRLCGIITVMDLMSCEAAGKQAELQNSVQ